MSNIDKINFKEACYFFKSEHSLIDYSNVSSFSLIKSSVEVLYYYGITDFTAADVKEFFEKLEFTQNDGRLFLPSVRKINSVLEVSLIPHKQYLSIKDDVYHIEKWNCDGYKSEIIRAYDMKWL